MPDDDQRAVGLGGEQRGVGDRQQRRRVDDDHVELTAQVVQQLSIASDWSSSDGFGGSGPQVSTFSPVSSNSWSASAQRHLADQHAGGADGVVQPEPGGDQGPPQVASTRTTLFLATPW